MQQKRFAFALGALMVCALWGCGHRGAPADKMIFRYNESAGIGTLDPAYSKDQALNWACAQLYNGLVQLDEQLQVQPCIAQAWEVSADGRCYVFHLRRDVYFHRNALFCKEVTAVGAEAVRDSTRRVTAQDFVYSFGRLRDARVASPGAWIFHAVDTVQPFTALDDSTLCVRLGYPFAPFLSLLAMPYCSVVPREVVEHYGADFRKHPCGTGPFRMQMWKEGVKLVLRRNTDYFERDSAGGRLPYLDAVAVTFIVDKQTVFLEFVKGRLDFMNSLDASYKDELLTRTGQLRAKYRDRIVMQSMPFLNTEYLGFNMADSASPCADRRVRQAICYAIDRGKMMKYLRNGVGHPGEAGFIPMGLPGADSAGGYGYGYDPARAQQLLAAAGYPHGQGLPELTLTTTSSYLDLCRYIQQQLGLIGVRVKLDVSPPAALREAIAQGKVAWFRGSWIADYPDAENYMSLFYSANGAPVGPNTTHFRNAQVDRLYRQSIREPQQERRWVTYRQMDSIVMQEAPVMILYYDQILHFTHPYVRGLRSNAMNALDLRRVRMER